MISGQSSKGGGNCLHEPTRSGSPCESSLKATQISGAVARCGLSCYRNKLSHGPTVRTAKIEDANSIA